jgi:hypothetical protein
VKTCDIDKVGLVSDLLAVPPPQRDVSWRRQFYEGVVDASFACGEPQVLVGIDGFPYFSLLTPEPYKPFDSYCLCNLAEPVINKGFGAAINPLGQGADWVFSYGDLLTLHLFGKLAVEGEPSPANLPARETIMQAERILVGQPSESYLPSSARAAIRQFLAQRAGIKDPGIYLMLRPSDNPSRQLVFSVYRNDFPSEVAFRSVLQGISWFLPRHYVVVSLDEEQRGSPNFEPL